MPKIGPPPFSALSAEESTGFLLWQVTALWQRAIAATLRPYALTQVQFVLLAGLLWLSQTEDEITQASLARHTRLDVMMTSQVLRSLERRGLVRRAAHSSDSRARRLSLTPKATALVSKALRAVELRDGEFFSRTRVDPQMLNRILLALIA